MEFDTKNKKEKIFYEQPSLKKHGTMKDLTLGSGGSPGDAMSGGTVNDTGNDSALSPGLDAGSANS